MSDYDIFAQKLKQLRNELGYTQKEFSEKIGCTQATLSAYENDPKNPSLDIILNIAKQCNVSIDWLLGLNKSRKSLNGKLETYSDIIYTLTSLDSADIDYKAYTANSTGEDNYAKDLKRISGFLEFRDEELVKFIGEWGKIRELYKEKTLPKDLYSMWIGKNIKERKELLIESDLPLE